MTDISPISVYMDLLTSEHRDQPRFRAAVEAMVSPLADITLALRSMAAITLNLDLAVGDALDTIGEWIGLPRRILTPIPGVYFSFNTPGLGINQGVFFNSEEPGEGVIEMDDNTYRLMLRGKIIANEWDGSLGQANTKLAEVFGAGQVQIRDNFDMTLSFVLSGTPPSVLFAQLVQQGYIELRPAGVAIV